MTRPSAWRPRARAREAQTRVRRPIVTRIVPAATFWPAEDYHQQYLEKRGIEHCHLPQPNE